MVKIRMIRQPQDAEWDSEKKILYLPWPLDRKAFLVGLHEIMHCLKGHKEESIEAEIEAWRGIRRVFSFLRLWIAADEKMVDWCLASHIVFHAFSREGAKRRVVNAIAQQYHPAKLCSDSADWKKVVEEASQYSFLLSINKTRIDEFIKF